MGEDSLECRGCEHCDSVIGTLMPRRAHRRLPCPCQPQPRRCSPRRAPLSPGVAVCWQMLDALDDDAIGHVIRPLLVGEFFAVLVLASTQTSNGFHESVFKLLG